MPHLVTHLYDRLKLPQTVIIKRIGILTALKEYARHLVQVILQTVKIV